MNSVTSSHNETVKILHDRSHVTSKINPYILPKAEVSTSANVLSASQSKPTYDRTYFLNKTLDYENFDYYGITDETLCPLCELGHDDDESIEGRYKAGSYFIKCEQCEIEIVA